MSPFSSSILLSFSQKNVAGHTEGFAEAPAAAATTSADLLHFNCGC